MVQPISHLPTGGADWCCVALDRQDRPGTAQPLGPGLWTLSRRGHVGCQAGRGGPKELGQTHLLSMGPRPPPGQQPGVQTPQSFPSLPQGLPRAPAFSPATSRPFRLGRPVPRALTLIPTPLYSCGLQPDRCSWLSLAWPCPMDSCGCGSCPPTSHTATPMPFPASPSRKHTSVPCTSPLASAPPHFQEQSDIPLPSACRRTGSTEPLCASRT